MNTRKTSHQKTVPWSDIAPIIVRLSMIHGDNYNNLARLIGHAQSSFSIYKTKNKVPVVVLQALKGVLYDMAPPPAPPITITKLMMSKSMLAHLIALAAKDGDTDLVVDLAAMMETADD